MADTSLARNQYDSHSSMYGHCVLDSHSRLSDHLGSSSGSQKAHILLDQALGQVEKTGLVVDGYNCYDRCQSKLCHGLKKCGRTDRN